jgi:predicted short-subunit dehydrogenase-like oxidoreductase (DUF2520 family)
MEVVIIGAGNVATVLGKLIVKRGHNVVQVFSQRLINAAQLADKINAVAINNLDEINLSADIYIIAVVDNAIASVAVSLHLSNQLLVHTSGTVSKDVLKGSSTNYGVLWPLQTLRKEIVLQPEIPFVVDGSNEEVKTAIESFAAQFSAIVIQADDDEKRKLHVAAVFASNFVNHLYVLTENYCKKENIDFKLLVPLIIETAERIKKYSPSEVQTGPAIRGDSVTIDKQLHDLEKYPFLRKMYLIITNSIQKLKDNKNPRPKNQAGI